MHEREGKSEIWLEGPVVKDFSEEVGDGIEKVGGWATSHPNRKV